MKENHPFAAMIDNSVASVDTLVDANTTSDVST